MSKKLTLFALIAVLVMAFAGSAFSAEYSWKGGPNDNWSAPDSWETGIVPKSMDIAVFPNSATTVLIVGSHDVGAIRIDSGADNVIFNLRDATSALHIVASQDVNGQATPGIRAQGNARFQGAGVVILAAGSTASGMIDGVAEDGAFLIDVFDGYTLDFGVVVSEDNTGFNANDIDRIIKANKGTLAFTSDQDNKLGANVVSFDVRDGEVAISRPGHIDGNTRLIFDTKNIQGRTATLTTTWTNNRRFEVSNKVIALTDGVINVSGGEGSTLTLTGAAAIVSADHEITITKMGPGTISMGDENVWAVNDADPLNWSTLDIAEGSVNIADDSAISGDNHININVGTGTNLRVGRTISDDIRNLTGSGTLTLAEGGVLTANGRGTEFSGKITGAGSIRFGTTGTRDARAEITGPENDYTGDTFVGVGSRLIIEDTANLGGKNTWSTGKIFLDVNDDQADVAGINNNEFAVLEIADGKNFTIPNEIFLGDSLQIDTDANANMGGAVIFVPVDTQLTLTNNITYNRNTLVKAGEGDLILEGIGYDNVGGGQFFVTGDGMQNGAIPNNGRILSTALHIVNGRVSIENDQAAANGDIVVDSGTSNATRPILSVRNGVKMINAIMFTASSTFATELIDANLADGTSVPSAVEVGYVYYNRYFEDGNRTTGNYSGMVYNRINFADLQAGTVKKGSRFQLMKSHNFNNYDANKVEPTNWDGKEKAPFDPYFSTVYLYFDALKTIDIPGIGDPSVTAIKPSEVFDFTVPVTSASGLKDNSQVVFTTPAIADISATIEGTNIRIRGTAPESGLVTFRVGVTSAGDVYNDILEYMAERTFDLLVGEGGTTPEVPSSYVPAPTSDVAAGTITASAFKYDADGNPVINETLKFVLTDTTTNDVVDEQPGITGTDGKATVTFEEIGEGTYTLAVFDANGVQIGTTRTITDFQPTDPGGSGSSGSSGCDAGFGAFALLALGAAAVLRKKD